MNELVAVRKIPLLSLSLSMVHSCFPSKKGLWNLHPKKVCLKAPTPMQIDSHLSLTILIFRAQTSRLRHIQLKNRQSSHKFHWMKRVPKGVKKEAASDLCVYLCLLGFVWFALFNQIHKGSSFGFCCLWTFKNVTVYPCMICAVRPWGWWVWLVSFYWCCFCCCYRAFLLPLRSQENFNTLKLGTCPSSIPFKINKVLGRIQVRVVVRQF